MASRNTGQKFPTALANDATVGTTDWTWAAVSDVRTSDNVYASNALSGTTDFAVDDNSIKLYNGSAFVGDEKASGTNWNLTTDTTRTYGGSTDVWGLTGSNLKPATWNASGAGVGISCQRDASTPESKYLLCSTFNLAIPSSAKIVGIDLTIECHYENSLSGGGGESFVRGTMISTPKGRVPIESLQEGDSIYGFKDGRIIEAVITKTHNRITGQQILLVIGGREIITTDNHPFFNGEGYTKAVDLKVGSVVYEAQGEILVPVVIEHKEAITARERVFNLTTDSRNYFANNVAVHNVLISGATNAYIDQILLRFYYRMIVDPIGHSGYSMPTAR